MSLDATVLCGLGTTQLWCVSFEIDGAVHFRQGLTHRRQEDAEKDALILAGNTMLMRLHFKDQHVWQKYIRFHIIQARQGVSYTDSYIHCLMGDEAAESIIASHAL